MPNTVSRISRMTDSTHPPMEDAEAFEDQLFRLRTATHKRINAFGRRTRQIGDAYLKRVSGLELIARRVQYRLDEIEQHDDIASYRTQVRAEKYRIRSAITALWDRHDAEMKRSVRYRTAHLRVFNTNFVGMRYALYNYEQRKSNEEQEDERRAAIHPPFVCDGSCLEEALDDTPDEEQQHDEDQHPDEPTQMTTDLCPEPPACPSHPQTPPTTQDLPLEYSPFYTPIFSPTNYEQLAFDPTDDNLRTPPTYIPDPTHNSTNAENNTVRVYGANVPLWDVEELLND